MKKMKVAVVGLGWMGKVHLRNYSQMPKVEVVGVLDVDEKILQEVHEQYDVPVFQDLEKLLDQGPEAVSVCVPTVHHHATAMAVIGRGIPLLVEKPLAASSAEGKELVATAKAKGVPLMVGHIERFNPAVERLHDLLSEENHVISIMFERVGPYPPRIQDVGVVRDLASHDIDLACHLTGSRYKSVSAFTSSNVGKHEDTVVLSGEMENGVLVQINCNWVTPYKSRKIHVATKTRYIEANLITQQVKEYSKFESYQQSYNVREWPVIFREPVREELTRFLAAVETGGPVPISGESGLYVLETIERITTCGA
ncbi:oxidoreductase domain protein [Desulfovibrio sp. X2]|uniref:Gfo/Idh/MocA family protein n=1 Tax=Desulfovibrio sp. X2 TaxID=941449 RepID=UPI000358C483|nr:Gfo/Idh/MocA family oxidoreductase [Desulfovibrio sp. X2]EPR44406.1 oxidoreductase domain protein [Desulfovibrio sp. X2]